MAQVTSGVRAVLSHPAVYEAFQRIMGATRGRERIVRDLIRPFPGMRILDLGCGPAEILDFLPQDVAYTGYDMSAEYIAAANAKFGARGTFCCRLLEQAEAVTLEPFDLVMGIGVLHHLDDGTARQFMTLAKAALKPGGRVLTLDACYAPNQNPIARFIISKDRGQHVRNEAGYRKLAEGIFTGIAGTVRHQAWIPYTHWSMECSG
ncbi:bifunctional 2-polyprenyl-6-hydroxyphenol methylase/3-demethylubiquinol 3-O-methyltransferase UbiG [Mycobacterium sp. TY815]|uniref:class I SAM-dependent methyltransferase n=1 Tax=Mycobacterium sp. TY815 TaxID=3050581 RepID=UPI0027408128|nr:class I SAM-dependent methyltransferase [Mycobacterium sp. TY815]MDP7702396.1 class I SAM-dependent methyltransferase [Mycobacterium sp. TY815]